MNKIIEHIEYLVRNQDCVIVPHLGGFVAQHIPAYYDEQSSCYFPPRRYVVFNSELNHNDGTLAMSISRKDGVSYDSALKSINEEVSAMKAQLKFEGSIALGHIGRFDYVEDRIIFSASDNFVVSPQYYGLSEIKIKPLDVEAENNNDDNVVTKKKWDLKRKVVYASRIAASIVIFILCGFLLSTPIIVDEETVRCASLSLPEITMPVPQKQVSGELNIARPDEKDGMAIVKEKVPGDVALKINLEDPYYLVVSALATRSQAEEYISYTKGYNLEIVETPSKKYRIIVATGNSVADVMKYTHNKSFASKFPDAWPCRK